jgi:hypothetical protein
MDSFFFSIASRISRSVSSRIACFDIPVAIPCSLPAFSAAPV